MPRGNPSAKLAITVDPNVHAEILALAARDGVSASAWLRAAAGIELKRQRGLAAIAEWEAEHGPFTAEEMDEANRQVDEEMERMNRRAAKRPA